MRLTSAFPIHNNQNSEAHNDEEHITQHNIFTFIILLTNGFTGAGNGCSCRTQ
jgi:hypothetical protein